MLYPCRIHRKLGRGIEKICSSCKSDGLPMPEFLINPSDIMVKFTAPKDRIVKEPSGVTERVTEKVTEKVTEGERAVLELLKIDPGYTYGDIAEKLSISRKTVSSRIKSLKDKKLIKRIGSDTQGHWETWEH